MATTWTSTSRSPAPENLMDTLFSYDNTILLAAIISLLLVILFVLLLHLYARWFLSGHHQSLHRPRPDHRLQVSTITTYDISPATKDSGTTGLDAATINSIPTFSYKEAEVEAALECAVCLSEFEEGEVGRRLPMCSHCFHVECVDTWLRAHITCPVCRLVVVQGKGGFGKEDEDRKDDVVLDIHDDDDDVGDDVASVESCSSGESAPESAAFERLMRVAVSRSRRSDVVGVANHRSERPRPSI